MGRPRDGRLGVAPDGVDVAAEAGEGEQDAGDERDAKKDPRGDRDAGEVSFMTMKPATEVVSRCRP